MTTVATDPIIRYGAAAVLLLTFLGALVVAVHGYLMIADYTPPPLINGVLAGAVTASLPLLGVHIGSTIATNAAAAAAPAAPASGATHA